MSVRTSAIRPFPASTAFRAKLILTALEVLLIYSGILLYIWRWQSSHPHAWMLLWAAVLASHAAHRDTLKSLGLTWFELRASAEIVLPLSLAIYVPLLAYGFARHMLVLTPPAKNALFPFINYGVWCAVQQYLTQSYFHRRLMSLVPSPHLSSVLVALMFGSAHLPNTILVIATALGGFLMAEVFARHPNIWPLALAQAVGGFLIAALAPASLIHNMRVGPGYYFFRVR